ncbi:hypothetical protein Hypma_010546 [Hypsizygus marmoreus]|uniref:Reverse transcriptase RNase H-like domain-containing protein n=1 Tax=Hypsizygus marmoreus TaxID=39966 RepID=A0A369JLZ1_HYPMA|nr:hypothetical protein Hypma_010546 [Hypsizygus marmoreus]
MRAITKWRSDLLGSHIHIYTDHKTLENFDSQRDLSRRQARWMEYLSQYEYTIHYIAGELNTIVDALSRLPDSVDSMNSPSLIAPVFEISSDPSIVANIKKGYTSDPWCKTLISDLKKQLLDAKLNIHLTDGLLFIGHCLIIPCFKDLRENLYRLAHDNLGHFSGSKSYTFLGMIFISRTCAGTSSVHTSPPAQNVNRTKAAQPKTLDHYTPFLSPTNALTPLQSTSLVRFPRTTVLTK